MRGAPKAAALEGARLPHPILLSFIEQYIV